MGSAQSNNWDQYPDAPMSPDHWDQYPDADQYQMPDSVASLPGRAMGALQSGLAKVDSYTGAPVRAAIYAAETSPTEMGRPSAGAKAFVSQFGQDTSKTPTGEDIANASGWVTPGSPIAKAAGFGVDLASNPTTYVPIGDVLSGAVKGVGGALGMGAKGAGAMADVAPAVDGALPAAKDAGAAAKAAGFAGETFTGIDKKLGANYAANTDRINQVIGQFSGPEGYEEAAHADAIRNQWSGVISAKKQALYDAITPGLDAAPKDPSIDVTPIIKSLEDTKAGLNPVTHADAIREIDSQIGTVKELANPSNSAGALMSAGGNAQETYGANAKNLYEIKQFLQQNAKGAYQKGGQMFVSSPAASSAARDAGAVARPIFQENGPKSVVAIDDTLSALHDADEGMNSTLLKDNGPVQVIGRAGTNPGGIEARSLNQLQKITGYNFTQDAKDFATAKAFSSAGLTPVETTGKSVARQALSKGVGGGLGYMVGGLPGAWVGSEAASSVLSPLGLKAGINAANVAGKAITAPLQAAQTVLPAAGRAAYGAMTSPAGRQMLDVGAKALLTQPAMAQSQQQANRSPAKGPDSWAQQGVQKLGIQDPAYMQKLMQDPKAKQLLIQASDLAPGSKAMKNIMNQIQKGWGNSK